MSGRSRNSVDYEELLRREREKKRQEEERRRRRELLLRQIASLEASNSSLLKELQENSDRLVSMLDSYEEAKRKSIVELKESYINSLVNFIEDDLLSEEEKEDIKEKVEKLKNSEKTIDIIKLGASAKLDIEDALIREKEIEKAREEEFKIFGIENIEENNQETKTYAVYKELQTMGYDPVYGPDSGKIIIKKENNDQIITEIKDSFLIQEFNDYEGKECATDINKIKNRLNSIGVLAEGVRYDLEWYQPLEKAKNKANYKKDNELYTRLKNSHKNTAYMKK